MSRRSTGLWAAHDRQFRDPMEVVSQWSAPGRFDSGLLDARTTGPWWEFLQQLGVTLFVTREYEHLLMAICVYRGRPRTSYLRLPHPNGLAFDPVRGRLHVASTRNPNVLFDFSPCDSAAPGTTARWLARHRGLLLPARSRFLPGSLYIHDLAMIGGRLHGCAAGMNAVVTFPDSGGFKPVWWPASIDGRAGRHRFERNYLQLNSIASGASLKSSWFTASTARPAGLRPGHPDFPVDGRGVLFSGRTRQAVIRGLTRPHSARRWRNRVWLDNSGYGEFGVVDGDRFEVVSRLPGWTRGLCFSGDVAFVATSRVIPRFRQYAPGLNSRRAECGVHAVDPASGTVLASIVWPRGNQIFAVEAVPAEWTVGLPIPVGRDSAAGRRDFFFRAGSRSRAL